MDLEGIMLSEIVRQRQMYDITCMWNLKKVEWQLPETGWGQGNGEMLVKGYKISVIRQVWKSNVQHGDYS